MKRNKTAGIGLAIFGFALILLSALSYLTHGQSPSPTAFIMGLVLFVVGISILRSPARK